MRKEDASTRNCAGYERKPLPSHRSPYHYTGLRPVSPLPAPMLIEVKRFSFFMCLAHETSTLPPLRRTIIIGTVQFCIGSRRHPFLCNAVHSSPTEIPPQTSYAGRCSTRVRSPTIHHTYFRPAIEDGVLLAVLACLSAYRDLDHGLGWIVELVRARARARTRGT